MAGEIKVDPAPVIVMTWDDRLPDELQATAAIRLRLARQKDAIRERCMQDMAVPSLTSHNARTQT